MATEDIGDLGVDVVADFSGFEEKFKARLKRIARKAAIAVKVAAETAAAEAQLVAMRAVNSRPIQVPVDIARGSLGRIAAFGFSARRELNAALSTIRIGFQNPDVAVKVLSARIQSGLSAIRVGVSTAWATADLVKWRAEQRRKAVDLVVRVSQKGLAGLGKHLKAITGISALQQEFLGFSRIFQGFFTNLPHLARMITLITSLGAVGVHAFGALAVSIASMGPAVAGLGAAVLALPGILLGAGAGIAAVVVAVKDAPPAVKDATKSFAGLKKVISGNFWAQAAGETTAFLQQLGPQVKAGMAGVATAVGGIVGLLAGSLRAEFSGGVVAGIFANIAAGAEALKPAVVPFASILRMLLQFGTSLLPGISTWLAKIALQFQGWLAEALETGRLNAMLADLGAFLQAAGSALFNLGRIIGGIATAALNAGIGGLFAGLEQIADIVNGPAFQTALTLFFQGAAEGSRALLAALTPIGEMLAYLMPTISGFLADAGTTLGALFGALANAMATPAFQAGLQSFLGGVLDFIRPLIPIAGLLIEKFAGIATVGGQILSALGPLFATALSVLLPVLTAVLQAVEPLITALASGLGSALTALAPVALTLVKALKPILDLVISLIPFAVQLISAIATGLGPVFEALVPIFTELAAAVFSVLEPLLRILMPLIGPLISLLVPLLTVALKPLIFAFQLLGVVIGAIAPILEIVAQVIGAVISTIVALFEGDFAKIGEIWTNLWNGLPEPLQTFITNTLGMFGDFFSNTIGMFSDFFNNAVKLGATFWTNTTGMFADFGAKLQTGWNNLWTGVGNIVKDVWNGVLGTIEGGVNGAIDLINGMIKGVNSVSGALGIGAIPIIGKLALPRLAQGGTILPRRGGTAAILGEGGKAESVVDTGLLNKLLAQVTKLFPKQVSAMRATLVGPTVGAAAAASGSTSNVFNNQFHGTSGDPAAEAQEFVNRLAEKVGLKK